MTTYWEKRQKDYGPPGYGPWTLAGQGSWIRDLGDGDSLTARLSAGGCLVVEFFVDDQRVSGCSTFGEEGWAHCDIRNAAGRIEDCPTRVRFIEKMGIEDKNDRLKYGIFSDVDK